MVVHIQARLHLIRLGFTQYTPPPPPPNPYSASRSLLLLLIVLPLLLLDRRWLSLSRRYRFTQMDTAHERTHTDPWPLRSPPLFFFFLTEYDSLSVSSNVNSTLNQARIEEKGTR